MSLSGPHGLLGGWLWCIQRLGNRSPRFRGVMLLSRRFKESMGVAAGVEGCRQDLCVSHRHAFFFGGRLWCILSCGGVAAILR